MVRVRFMGWSSRFAVATVAGEPFFAAFEAGEALPFPFLCCSVPGKQAGICLRG